jgi:type IX secretion system PorP/SprF family membrane protein
MKNKQVGLGVSLAYDRMGPLRHTGLSGMYSYTLPVNSESDLIFGIRGEFLFRQIHLSTLELVDQGDQLFASDPGLKLQPNVGFGFNYKVRNYSFHLSLPRLLKSKLSPIDGEASRWSRTPRVVYLGGTAEFMFQEIWKLRPSVLAAFAGGFPPFLETAAMVYYRDQIGWGAFYRFNRSWGTRIRYNYLDRYVVGYSFDLSFNDTRYNAGTHEIFLGYNFPFNKIKTLSPRRF